MFNLAGVRAIHTQDGKDIIMSIESSWLQLETSSKADDENLIAEVVKQKMDKGMVKITHEQYVQQKHESTFLDLLLEPSHVKKQKSNFGIYLIHTELAM